MNKTIKTVGVIAMCAMITGCNESVAASTSASSEDLAIELIAKCEGFRGYVYECSAGRKTIGYGFTAKDLVAKGTMTEAEAKKILRTHVKDILTYIRSETKGVKLTAGQEAAICSFVFNVGRTAFKNSTMLKRIKANDLAAAANEFHRWNRSGGNVVKGLVNRRNREVAYWNRT